MRELHECTVRLGGLTTPQCVLWACCALIFLVSSKATANTGHWRSVEASSLRRLDQNGQVSSVLLGVLPSTGESECIETTWVEFDVFDARDVVDMVYETRPEARGKIVRGRVSCVDQAGDEIAVLSERQRLNIGMRFEVPTQCLRGEAARFKVQAEPGKCVPARRHILKVRSYYRKTTLTGVLDPSGTGIGLCGENCIESLASKDGVFVEELVCTGPNGQMSQKDLVFSTMDYATASDAILELALRGSSPDTKYQVSCVDELSGFEYPLGYPSLAQLATQTVGIEVPMHCLKGNSTTLRLAVKDEGCLHVDSASLMLRTKFRARYPLRYRTSGPCDENEASREKKLDCLKQLSRHDNQYVENFACGSPEGAFVGPTTLGFSLPDAHSISEIYLELSTKVDSHATELDLQCVDSKGIALSAIAPTRRPSPGKTVEWFKVPSSCIFRSQVMIRSSQPASACFDLEYARLFTRSEENEGRDAVDAMVLAYADKRGVGAGEPLVLYIHSLVDEVTVEVYRVGRTLERVAKHDNIRAFRQSKNALAYRDGAGFTPSFRLETNKTWESGMYAVKVTGGGADAWVSFILSQPLLGERKSTVVVASTNTWNAYNDWGGASLYGYAEKDESHRGASPLVAFDRPNPDAAPTATDAGAGYQAGHLANGERLLLGWMDEKGMSYDMVASELLERNPRALDGYSTVVLNTHPEYWTHEMYRSIRLHLERGGSVAALSGNSLYWRTTIRGNQMETQKSGQNHLHDGEAGGLWRAVGEPESAVLGVEYTSWGFGSTGSYEVEVPDHPIFAGTNLEKGDVIGQNGYRHRHGIGASAWETDKMSPSSPPQTKLLARGTNKVGGAHMTFYETGRGGAVFSVGSLTYNKSLDFDSSISRITENFFSMPFTKRKRVTANAEHMPQADCEASQHCSEYVFSDTGSRQAASAFVELVTSSVDESFSADAFCLDAAGKRVQWIGFLRRQAGKSRSLYLEIPHACDDEGTVRIQLRSRKKYEGTTLRLLSFRHGLKFPLREVLSPVYCDKRQRCVDSLRSFDERFLRWVACTNGRLTSTELSSPSIFYFKSDMPLSDPYLRLRTIVPGPKGKFRVTCLDEDLKHRATLEPKIHLPMHRTTTEIPVPAKCRAADGGFRISILRVGDNCVGLDAVSLIDRG